MVKYGKLVICMIFFYLSIYIDISLCICVCVCILYVCSYLSIYICIYICIFHPPPHSALTAYTLKGGLFIGSMMKYVYIAFCDEIIFSNTFPTDSQTQTDRPTDRKTLWFIGNTSKNCKWWNQGREPFLDNQMGLWTEICRYPFVAKYVGPTSIYVWD